MSTTMTDTPTQGTGIEGATAAIERLLTRESGQPAARETKRKPEPAEASDAEAPQAEPEEETPDEGADTPEQEAPAEEEEAPDTEAEGEAEPEEETAEEAAAKPPPIVTVKIDGKDEPLPLDEVIKGYQRQADYTRKTMALAEERKAFQGEAEVTRQERNQYGQLLGMLGQQIQALQQAQQPDWDSLYRDNPLEYVRQKEAWRDREQQLAAVEQEKQRVAALNQADANEKRLQTLKDERDKMLAARPEWRDGAKWKEDQQHIREYGRSLGWTDKEMSNITEHRVVMTLWKAMQYDAAMKQKPPVPTVPKPRVAPAAPGARAAVPRTVSEHTRAKQRLARSGSIADAAAVIERLL
jgi:hypothetical protein